MVDYDLVEKVNDPDKTLTTLRRFIEKHRITVPESIYQMDSILEVLPELVEELCDSAGYFVEEDEEDIFDEGDPDNVFYDEE